MIHAIRWLLCCAALFSITSRVVAQARPSERSQELQAKALAACQRHNYPEAERLFREQLALGEGGFDVYYNLACVRSMQDDGPGSAELLVQAVEHGFTDLVHLERDPDLAVARAQEPIRKLIEKWPEVLSRHVEANLKLTREFFPNLPFEYKETRDDRMRLVFLSAMDARATDQAHADITRLYNWGVANVFADLADEAKAPCDAWTIVVLPTSRDFQRWAVASYGLDAVTGLSGIGGAYDDDVKRLVSMDLGPTLRHEFFHVLHWRSNLRLHQRHPVWIQEGLCSLVESYTTAPDGSITPTTCWRTNIAKRMAANGKLLSIQKLAAIPRDRFIASSPLANYAQARTFFLYLYGRGKLKDWYALYLADFDKDPTGIKSLEAVLAKPMADVNKDYLAWVRALPMVAEQIKQGKAGLGAEVDPGSGDGPVIAEVDRNGPARKAGLKPGDVITAIDGSPTRDLNELVRILGEHELGDEVEVSYRRGRSHNTVKIKLVRR